MSDVIRMALVEPQGVVRMGVRHLLQAHPDILLASEAQDARDMADQLRRWPADVLVMEIASPDGADIDGVQALRRRHPKMPILVYSHLHEERHAPMLLNQGLQGFLSKMAPEDELPRAVRALHQGRHYYAGSVAKLLAAQWTGSAIRPPHEHLSERELQVFFGLAKGETLSQVAQRMCLSIKTVSTYRSRLIAKLKVQTNSELTYYALKEGLIE